MTARTARWPCVLTLLVAVLIAWPTIVAGAEAAGPSARALTAQDVQAALDSKSIDLDTVWTLVAAFLVMWMQAGFAMVETGFTRAKNAVNILMKNLLDYCFGSIAFWAVGFGLMFSIGNAFVGDSGFFLHETPVQVTRADGAMHGHDQLRSY